MRKIVITVILCLVSQNLHAAAVTTESGGDDTGSLRQVVQAAVAGDTIDFDSSVRHIKLDDTATGAGTNLQFLGTSTGTIDMSGLASDIATLRQSIVSDGGACGPSAVLQIDAATGLLIAKYADQTLTAAPILDGQNAHQILALSGDSDTGHTFEALTLINGYDDYKNPKTGQQNERAFAAGGAIFAGTINHETGITSRYKIASITDSIFRNNRAKAVGGDDAYGGTGAIANAPADAYASGGAVSNQGNGTIEKSLFSGTSALAPGGRFCRKRPLHRLRHLHLHRQRLRRSGLQRRVE